jgi:multiple sugar transport system permease protein
VAGSMIFLLLFNPGGLVNTGLRFLGLPTPGWLLDPLWSKPTLIIMSLWGLGSSAIIFLASLKEVPLSLIESAEIDGANYTQRLFRIVLPLISPIILFNLVMEIIESFQVFTQAFIIGGMNGQPLESTLFYMTVIYRNAFRYFSMGYASALAILLFLAVLIITVIIYVTSGKWVFYENASRGR